MKEFLGMLIALNSVAIFAFLVISSRTTMSIAVPFACLGVIVGVVAALGDRLGSLKLPGGMEIATAKQDLAAITEIRKDVEKQRDAIALIVRDANSAREQIERTEALARQADTAIRKINDASDFSMLVLKAQADDRHAFDELSKMGESPGPYQQLANAAATNIVFSVVLRASLLRSAPDWEVIGLDPSSVSLDELEKYCLRKGGLLRIESLRGVWQRPHSVKPEDSDGKRIDFLVDRISNDDNLVVAYVACSLVDQEAHLMERPEDANYLQHIDKFVDWWTAHKKEYINDSFLYIDFNSSADNTPSAIVRVHGDDPIVQVRFDVVNPSEFIRWNAEMGAIVDAKRRNSFGVGWQYNQSYSVGHEGVELNKPFKFPFPEDGNGDFVIRIRQLNGQAIEVVSMRQDSKGKNAFAYRVFQIVDDDGFILKVREITELRHIDDNFPLDSDGKCDWVDHSEKWNPPNYTNNILELQ
jgi:hypothetical protein